MRNIVTIIIVLFALIAGGYWGYSLAAKTDSAAESSVQAQSIEDIQAQEGKPVQVEAIIQKDLALTQTFYGSVTPYAEADIQGKTGGTVTYLKGVEGDRVTKGDVIVRFDDSSTQLQLQQAIASKNAAEQNVKQALSNYETLQKTLNRYQELFKEGLIPQQNLDELQNQLQGAQAGLESARQQVASAETQVEMLQNTLRDMTIKAPFSGIIDQKNFNLNEIAGARAIIYHLVDLDQVYVEVEIPESHISQIQEQMNVAISFDSLKGQQFTGHIERILPTGNQQRRMFTAKVLVENSEHWIKPGMFARVEVELERIPDALVFTKKALLKEGDDYYVFKVVDNQAQKVPVDIALREGDTVAVRSAELAPQDRVVVEGAHLVAAQDRVKVLN
jgi:RND family efflux transporter MFP subunit